MRVTPSFFKSEHKKQESAKYPLLKKSKNNP
jgi:hypothetical protein